MPHKYDEACTAARIATGASGIILIILDGEHGPGFSMQAPPSLVPDMPGLLRRMADDIERAA